MAKPATHSRGIERNLSFQGTTFESERKARKHWQRPGTAKGPCFISLEDETGIANLFVKKETFHRLRMVITAQPFVLADGRLQRSEGDQPTVYVTGISPLPRANRIQAASHDFH